MPYPDTAEHRFKASDIRRAIRLSQQQPAYLQINVQATNKEIGSAKAKALQFSKSLCGYCNNTRTQPYDRAWERLSEYIRTNWRQIRERRSLDLAVPFPGAIERGTLDVHLFFLKLFGCKVVQDREPICNLEGRPYSESGFRANWHRLMQKTLTERRSRNRSRFMICGPKARATKQIRAPRRSASRTMTQGPLERCTCGSRGERAQAQKY